MGNRLHETTRQLAQRNRIERFPAMLPCAVGFALGRAGFSAVHPAHGFSVDGW